MDPLLVMVSMGTMALPTGSLTVIASIELLESTTIDPEVMLQVPEVGAEITPVEQSA
jgi:hypothetical protein